MTLKAWVGMWALGLAALIAATSAAAACDWHKSMTMASTPAAPAVVKKVASTPAPQMSPVVHKKVVISTYPVDLWLLPYLS